MRFSDEFDEEYDDRKKRLDVEPSDLDKPDMTATDVKETMTDMALSDWLPAVDPDANIKSWYEWFDEFKVEAKKKDEDFGQDRRLDLICLIDRFWGLNQYESRRIQTVGFEIKVSPGDLLGDTKLVDYTLFSNRFYILIPDETDMINVGQAVIDDFGRDDIGLATVDSGGCFDIQIQAERTDVDGYERGNLFQYIARKSLKEGREWNQ